MRNRVAIPKTKTFQGCWTCRRRKVRCSGPRPICARCIKANLVCEGFGTKLCWVAEGGTRNGDGLNRERIELPRGIHILHIFDEDQTTHMLDEIELCAGALKSSLTTSHGPFSVFRAAPETSKGLASLQDSREELIEQHSGSEDDAHSLEDVRISTSLVESVLEETDVSADRVENHDVLSFNRSTFIKPCQHLTLTAQSTEYPVNEMFCHYLLQVADVSQVIAHPENVFRSIYAEYAIPVWTQDDFSIAILGSQDASSRNAIFCSMVSTAAFHLRGLSSVKHANWNLYNQAGMAYRIRALQHLRKALTGPALEPAAQCAVLSAMLTTVDSDLMEGNLNDFFSHFQAYRYARSCSIFQSHQRIATDDRLRQLEMNLMFMETIAITTARERIDLANSYPRSADLNRLESPFLSSDDFLEHTYGITPSLASMVFSINELWHCARHCDDSDILGEVQHKIKQLADEIEAWDPSLETFASVVSGGIASATLLRSLSRAFWYAIRIYFRACFIPRFWAWESMPAVLSECALLALEQSEDLRSLMSMTGTSLSWPAFIGACEAPASLRNRWTRYWEILLKHKIGTQEAAWKVVQEVWRQQDCSSEQPSIATTMSAWSGTLKDFEAVEPSWAVIIRSSGLAIVAL